jgi:formate dehydrogenase alpha subunit
MTLRIDGQTLDLVPGETLLQAARRAGVEVPALCHLEGLRPVGGCRLCMVEIDGANPVAACHTEARPGMEVRTATPALRTLRQGLLGLYASAHPSAARSGAFAALLAAHEVAPPQPKDQWPEPDYDTRHPYLRFDAQQCVVCRRCVQACAEIQGQFVIGVALRGGDTALAIGADGTFESGDCVSCGICVEACPTGALTDRDRLHAPAVETLTHTVCGYCGVGCRVEVAQADGRVLHLRGVPGAAVNDGHLCAKGRYAHRWHRSSDRLTTPLVRKDGALVPVGWPEALRYTADRLLALRDTAGPDALGVFTSSRSTNEAAYLLQKLFREQLGTNNVDCCARVCHSSTALGLRLVTGAGAASASYDDIDRAQTIILAGANPTAAHPVVGARLKQAVLRGAKLVVIDPRRIELADYADVHLQLGPGSNVALFNALGKLLLEADAIDHAYLAERVEGLHAYRTFVAGLSLADAARTTGISAETIRAAAAIMAEGPCLFVHGLGLSELCQGTASVMTLAGLGLLTGSVGRPGAGMLPLRGQNNVQGNADMGGMPNLLAGYQALDDPTVQARLAKHWQRLPPTTPGLTISEMVDAAAHGRIKGLWIQGEDIIQSDPNTSHVESALDRLELLIVQELFLTETAKRADIVLPAAGYLEQSGTFTNGERRIQRVRAAVPPPGEALPDWQATRDVALAMGAPWRYPNPAAVMDEVAAVAPGLFGGVSYDRLGPDGLQWPCPTPDHPGTHSVHAEGFLRGQGLLVTIADAPSPEHGVAGYPLLLITGRVLQHYNVGTMTRRTPSVELVSHDALTVHPADAERYGVIDGGRITVESRWGQTTVVARHDPRTAEGTVFLSFHFPETDTNRVTGPHVDPQSMCPQYKATAVRLRSI